MHGRRGHIGLLPWASSGLCPTDQQASQNMSQILSLPPQIPMMLPSSFRRNPSSPGADRPSATRPYSPAPHLVWPSREMLPSLVPPAAPAACRKLPPASGSTASSPHGGFFPCLPKGTLPTHTQCKWELPGPLHLLPCAALPTDLLTQTSPTRLLACCLRVECKLHEDGTAFRCI